MLSQKPWRAEAVGMLGLGVLTGLCAGNVAAALAAGADAQGKPAGAGLSFPALVLGTLSFHGVALALMTPFLRAHGVSWIEGFGLAKAGRRWVWRGAAAGLAAVPVAYLLQAASAWMLVQSGFHPTLQNAVDMLVKGGPWWQRAYLLVFAVGVAPAAEEALFRGVLLPFLRDRFGVGPAVAATSAVFGLMHGNAAAFAPLTLLGAWLAWLYLRSGNLLGSIAAHAAFNLVPFVSVWTGLASPDS